MSDNTTPDASNQWRENDITIADLSDAEPVLSDDGRREIMERHGER